MALRRRRALQETTQRLIARDRREELATYGKLLFERPSAPQSKTKRKAEVPYWWRDPVTVLLEALKLEPMRRNERFFAAFGAALFALPSTAMFGAGFLVGPRDLWFTAAGSFLGVQLAIPYGQWRRGVLRMLERGRRSGHKRARDFFRYEELGMRYGAGLHATYPPYGLSNWRRSRLRVRARKLEREWDRTFVKVHNWPDNGRFKPGFPPLYRPKSRVSWHWWQRHGPLRWANERRAARVLRRAGKLLIDTSLLLPRETRSVEDLPALYMAMCFGYRYRRSPTRLQKAIFACDISFDPGPAAYPVGLSVPRLSGQGITFHAFDRL